jgi:hypothetical protein
VVTGMRSNVAARKKKGPQRGPFGFGSFFLLALCGHRTATALSGSASGVAEAAKTNQHHYPR